MAIDGLGGGLYGSPTMRHCVVAWNAASNSGTYGTPRGLGDGIYSPGRARIDRCLFMNNWEGIRGQVVVTNTVVRDGENGILALGLVQNCTVVSCSGSGIIELSWNLPSLHFKSLTVVNTISRDHFRPMRSSVDVSYSNIEGGHPGLGNFDVDPSYVGPLRGDYHLQSASPCIDAGDPSLFDPDGTRSDVGAYPFQALYHVPLVDSNLYFDPSWPEMSVALGGTVRMRVAEPLAGGMNYRLLGTLSGSLPGFAFQGTSIPINPDGYTRLALRTPNTAPFTGFAGQLPANGITRMRDIALEVPPQRSAALAGTTVHHALVASDPGLAPAVVTPPLALELVR